MSIEAMKQALAALETCRIRSVSEWEVSDVTPKNVTAAISALRTAIQQVAVQQPATGEPVACANPDGLKSNWHAHHVIVNKAALQMVRNALRNDVERGLKVRGEMLAELDLATFQAHPAPSVLDDVVRDAERYRFIRDADVSDDLIPDIALYAMESLDEYIDAAMLAAKKASA